MDGTLDDTPGTPSASSASGRRLVPPEVREAISKHHLAFGRYISVKELGRGGMGAVFKAWDSDLGRWVALKVMLSGSFAAADERERFLREAQTGAQFAHPNIAQVYEVGVANEQPFIAMQYIEGRTLHDFTPKELTSKRAAEILRDAARALHYAHGHKVIHRDVKPQNLMVARNGQVSVLDFGLARDVDVKSSLSVTGYAVGTPAYMSPEQARGDRNIRHTTDVYALGATLYYAITGKRPFEGANPHSIITAVMEELPVPPSRRAAHVPPDLEAIVLKAMEKRPERRYATADDFADDLQRFILGEPIRARPPSAMVRLLHAAAKHKALTASVAVGLVAATVLTISLVVMSSRSQAVQALEREENLQREKQRAEESVTRQKLDAEIAALGADIEAWATILHDPPQPLAPHFARLRTMLAKLQKIEIDSPARWRFIGRAHDLLGDLEKAEDAFQHAKAWPERGRVRLRLLERILRASAYIKSAGLKLQEEKRAASLRAGALEDFGRSPEASLRLAVLEQKNVYSTALDLATGTLDADAWDLAADAAVAAQRPPAVVIGHREKALRIRESDINLMVKAAYAHRGQAGTDWGNVEQNLALLKAAEAHSRTALHLQPESRDALLAHSFILMGYYWQWFMTRDSSRFGGSEGLLKIMAEAKAAAESAGAEDDVGTAFALCEILLRVPMVQVESGVDPTDSAREFLRVSEIHFKHYPEMNVVTDRGYAYVLLSQGEVVYRKSNSGLLPTYAQECEKECSRGDGKSECYFYYPGLCWYYSGTTRQNVEDLNRAIDWFTKAIASQTEAHRLAYSHRGRAYYFTGRFAQAVRDLDAAALPQDAQILEAARQRAGDR